MTTSGRRQPLGRWRLAFPPGARVFLCVAGIVLGCLAIPPAGTPRDEDRFAAERKNMVETQVVARGIGDAAVLEALRTVPRHLFVPSELWNEVYGDYPVPIGEGQTISQPYIVAFMTASLGLKKGDKVLEIGTGSGYQAAVLSLLARTVYTIEINDRLAQRAGETLKKLGYANVRVRCGDGFFGWPEEAPFDAVIVTCAVDHVPARLFDQLGEGGRLLLPLGDARTFQTLTVVTKKHGRPVMQALLDVRFVPMTGAAIKK